ncbi:hypothetical protein GGI43DRAFT_388312 [Trichoderma evansii]
MDDLHLPYTHEDYTIGWVCALPKEQSAAIFMLEERHEDLPNPSGDHNAYTLGGIGKHKVVIAGLPKGRVGIHSAATVATRMVSTFPNIRIGLMVGIGGGIPQKTRLGDVVISCPSGTEPGVVQWDMGKAEADGQFVRTGSLAPPPTALLTALTKFEADQITTRTNMLNYLKSLESIPNIPKSFLKSGSLQDVLYESSYNHKEGDDCRLCDKSRVVQRSPREDEIIIHCGLIASGNQVIKDAILRDKLYKQFNNNILCIEMEAAGLMNDFPCVVIRGICDYADSHKNDQWQDYAAATAAACAKALLKVLPSSEVDKLQRVQLTISPGLMEGAKRYLSFWRGDKRDVSDPSAAMASQKDVKDKADEQLPQTPSPGLTKSRDASPDVKSRDAGPSEMSTQIVATNASTQAAPAEMSAQTKSDNISQPQSVETWLRGAPTSLAAMLQQGNVEDAVRSICMGLSEMMASQGRGNATQGYTTGRDNNHRDHDRSYETESGNYALASPPERSKSWGDTPSRDSAPFQEEYKGHATEQSHHHGNVGWNFNTTPYPPRTPSPFQPEYRLYNHERSLSYGNDGTIPQAFQSLSKPTAYLPRTPSPAQKEYRSGIPEQPQNHSCNQSFRNAPAPTNLHISTKYSSSGYDASGNGVRDYPWSPPQSPTFRTNMGQDHKTRRVSEPVTNYGMNPPAYDPDTEDDRFFGYKYGAYYAEPNAINPNERQRIARHSQDRQPSTMIKNTSAYDPVIRNNGAVLGHRRIQLSEPSPISPSKGLRSATPIPSQRPPIKARSTPVREPATKDNDQSLRSRRACCNPEPSLVIPSERRRSTTPSQSRQPPHTVTSNRDPTELDYGPCRPQSRPPSQAQAIPPHVIRNVQSQRLSKIPRPFRP